MLVLRVSYIVVVQLCRGLKVAGFLLRLQITLKEDLKVLGKRTVLGLLSLRSGQQHLAWLHDWQH